MSHYRHSPETSRRRSNFGCWRNPQKRDLPIPYHLQTPESRWCQYRHSKLRAALLANRGYQCSQGETSDREWWRREHRRGWMSHYRRSPCSNLGHSSSGHSQSQQMQDLPTPYHPQTPEMKWYQCHHSKFRAGRLANLGCQCSQEVTSDREL